MSQPKISGLTALEWVERAKETLHERTREEDDTQLIDAHDDLCNASELLSRSKRP